MGKYSHKIVMKLDKMDIIVRVNAVHDTLANALAKYHRNYELAHTVTVQRFPLKDNPVEILKKKEPGK